MAVRLEGTTKRFIGLSTDAKPYVGAQLDGSMIASTDLPAGSSFFETDTWRIARFDGLEWQHERTGIDTDGLLLQLLEEQKKSNEFLELLLGKF